jgi:hypothetical protein
MGAGRFRQQPAESMSLDRILRFREILALSTRMIFLNIFNRTQLSNPTTTSPLAATTCTGAVSRGLRESGDSWPAHGPALGSVTTSEARRFCRPGKACWRCEYSSQGMQEAGVRSEHSRNKGGSCPIDQA